MKAVRIINALGDAWWQFVLAAALIIALLLMVSCGKTPIAPTDSTLSTVSSSAIPPDPLPPVPGLESPVPVWTLSGNNNIEPTCEQAQVPPVGNYFWNVVVRDSGPRALRTLTMVHHSDTAGCAATTQNPRDYLEVNAQAFYSPHTIGTLQLTFDSRHFDCGSAQVDASFLDTEGNEFLIFGTVINYGRNCPEPPKPPAPKPVPVPTPAPVPPVVTTPAPPPSVPDPSPTPVPVPPFPIPPPPKDPPPDDSPRVQTDCRTFLRDVSVHGGSAMFTILPGGNVELSFVSYTIPPDTTSFLHPPQTFYDGKSGVFTAGTYVMSISVNGAAFWQSDLYCGPYRHGEDLSPETLLDYGPREVGHDSNYYAQSVSPHSMIGRR